MSRRDGGYETNLLARLTTVPLILLVRAYQVTVSPLFGDCCRFTPSCSEYMIEALKVHGPLKGAMLGFWRVLRCHPFGAKGFDPVPSRGRWKNEQS